MFEIICNLGLGIDLHKRKITSGQHHFYVQWEDESILHLYVLYVLYV